MKTTLKTTLLAILLILTTFAQQTYAQGGDPPATGLEQAIKSEYLTIEND
jgi:hypothetical protein